MTFQLHSLQMDFPNGNLFSILIILCKLTEFDTKFGTQG